MCLPSGSVTTKTEANTIELLQYLMKKYNISIDRVVRHYDASRKNCPAQFNLDKKWTRWYVFKNKLMNDAKATFTVFTSKFKIGDIVTVQLLADKYQTGQKIKSFVKGNKYTIKQVKIVNQSMSNYAYLLGGINSWVLEQDLK